MAQFNAREKDIYIFNLIRLRGTNCHAKFARHAWEEKKKQYNIPLNVHR